MKILMLSNTPISPYVDGAGLRNFHLARHLARRHGIEILQVRGSGAIGPPLGPPEDCATEFREALDGMETVIRGRKTRVRFGFLRDSQGVRRALARRDLDDYDVIWGHSADWAYFLPKRHLRRTVLDVQDCYDLSYRRRMSSGSGAGGCVKLYLKRALYRFYVRRYMVPVKAVVLVNGADADSMRRLLPDRSVAVIPNGVDASRFREPPDREGPPGPPTVLFVGAMGAEHNRRAAQFFARRVLPAVRRRVPECRFRIVGHGAGQSVRELERTVDGMEVVGGVPDVRPYLWSATACVAPMRSGTGIKNKILEAWAAGCPVVTTRLGCEALLARDGENLLVADKPAAMAERVVLLA